MERRGVSLINVILTLITVALMLSRPCKAWMQGGHFTLTLMPETMSTTSSAAAAMCWLSHPSMSVKRR